MKRKVIRVQRSTVLILAGVVLLGTGVATAQASQPPHHKVTLCHRTGSVTGGNQHNGYSIITVDIASVANAKDVGGHDSHDQIGNGPGGDIIPSYTYGAFTYPGKNLGNGGAALLANGCKPHMPEKPGPVVKVTSSAVTNCDTKTVTTTTVTTTTDWVLKNNMWTKDTPKSVNTVTTREATTEECKTGVPPKPAPVVVVTSSAVTNCDTKTVTTTTVTTTTDWVLKNNMWTKDTPKSADKVTTRKATTDECKTVVSPKPVPPVTVGGVGAGAPPAAKPPVMVLGVGAAVAPAGAAANPLPLAASAGQADTSGRLVAGGFAAFAAFLMLVAGFVLRRRHGEA